MLIFDNYIFSKKLSHRKKQQVLFYDFFLCNYENIQRNQKKKKKKTKENLP